MKSNELRSTKALKGELKTIIESSYGGIFMTDNIGRILRINNAFLRIMEAKEEDFLNKTIQELYEKGTFKQCVPLREMQNGKPVNSFE